MRKGRTFVPNFVTYEIIRVEDRTDRRHRPRDGTWRFPQTHRRDGLHQGRDGGGVAQRPSARPREI